MTTKVRCAELHDLIYITSLARKESQQIGFIPRQRWEKTILGINVNQQMYVATDNNDLTGFAYTSIFRRKARIFQICIQEDARRWKRANLIVAKFLTLAKMNDCVSCQMRVAADIEANHFWKAMGFTPTGIGTGRRGKGKAKGGRKIIYYYKQLTREFWPDAKHEIMIVDESYRPSCPI